MQIPRDAQSKGFEKARQGIRQFFESGEIPNFDGAGTRALEAAQAALKAVKPGDGQKARALYNIACYFCAFFPGNEEEALEKLDQAILTDEWYKPVARGDSDFDSIRSNPKFKDRFDQIVT
jgi:hypothetical protein